MLLLDTTNEKRLMLAEDENYQSAHADLLKMLLQTA